MKKFSKYFGNQITSAVLKLHQKLNAAKNASCYNNIVGEDNKIEKGAGQRKKDPLILKVRIQHAYRKFFYYMITGKCWVRCTEEEWSGQFDQVEDIHVFEINKHNYNKL